MAYAIEQIARNAYKYHGNKLYFLNEDILHSKSLIKDINNPNFGFLSLKSRWLTIWPSFERIPR